jgi:hypothetical protein
MSSGHFSIAETNDENDPAVNFCVHTFAKKKRNKFDSLFIFARSKTVFFFTYFHAYCLKEVEACIGQ